MLEQLQCVAAVSALIWLVTSSTLEPSRKRLKCDPGCACSMSQIRHEQVVTMSCQNLDLRHRQLPLPPPESKKTRTRLYLEHGKFPDILNTTLSVYAPYKITLLSLKNNAIEHVAKDAFGNLSHLETLDLSENFINEDILKEAFSGMAQTPMAALNISSMNLQNVSDDFFKHLENIANFQLVFRNNTIMFPKSALTRLNLMVSLDLGGNNLIHIDLHNTSFTSLKYLNLDNNRLYVFPNFCFQESTSSRFPNLKILKIQWNDMRYMHPHHYNCLTNLTHFYLNGNLFRELKSNQFAMLPHIYKITLSYVGCAMRTIERAVFNNSALKQIYFRNNHKWFHNWGTSTEYSLHIFDGCSSLELLNLDDNIFRSTTEDDFNILLGDLTSLQVLIMGGCYLTYIPRVIPQKLTNITSLALYGNIISDLKPLQNMPSLKKLFMGGNQIATIDESIFQPLKRNITKMYLSSNPFSCTCNIFWLVDWMRKEPETFGFIKDPKSKTAYSCSSPWNRKGRQLLHLEMSEITCLLNMGEKITTLTLSVLLIVFLLAGSVMYRYRWHIRYFIYMVRYSQRQEVDTAIYEYDAFVAYSAQDQPWVIKTLLPVLEGKESLNLCLHDRDFQVGKLIVDNIVDAIEASRKIVIVLSNEFAQSGWCRFELNLIQRHVLENGQRLLVVVLLEEIDTRHVTKAMRAMLQTTTYLMWGEEEYARKAFFNRLRMLLRKATKSGRKRTLSV